MATYVCVIATVILFTDGLISAAVFNGNRREQRQVATNRSVYTLRAEVVNSTSVSLKWSPLTQDGGVSDDVTACTPRLFLIRLKQDSARRVRTWKVDGARSSVSLHGLLANTVYYVRIVSVDCHAHNRPSRWVTVKTLSVSSTTDTNQQQQTETAAPGQPVDVNTKALSDSVLVSWRPPEDGTLVRGYVVGYGEGVPDVSWQYLEAHRRNVTIRNLKKETQYVISVRAFNNVAKGPVVYDLVYTTNTPGEVGQLESSSSRPSLLAPTNVQSKVLSSTTVWLQWTDPSIGRQQTVPDSRFYSVHYQPVNGPGNVHQLTDHKALSAVARDLHIILYNLQPATRYEFKVRTIKDSQTSPYSNTVTNRTYETAPSSAPRDVRVAQLVDDVVTTVRVRWRPPRHSNGNVTEYLVFYTYSDTLPVERWHIQSVSGSQLLTTLYGLNTSLTYYFRVQARNLHGFGPKSDIVKLDLVAVRPWTSTAESILESQTVTAANNDINDTSNDNTDIDDAVDPDDSHYDYIDNEESFNNNSSNPTPSSKSKREPNSQHFPPTDISQASDESLTPRVVPFQVIVTHRVSVFLTWPQQTSLSTDDGHVKLCTGQRQRQPLDPSGRSVALGLGRVVGYRLHYWRVDDSSRETVSRYLTENLILLEDLLPNKQYIYQVKYITEQRQSDRESQQQPADGLEDEQEVGWWSQQAQFETNSST